MFGGSWASTLALAYAETHPERVTELVLRGIFLLRRSGSGSGSIRTPEGAASIFPDLWESYVEPIPGSRARRHDGRVLQASHEHGSGSSSPRGDLHGQCGRRNELLMRHEHDYVTKFKEDAAYAAAFARIECHYFVNKGFLRRRQSAPRRGAARIRHIPAVIVQGRYDMVCPMRSAWASAQGLAGGGPANRRRRRPLRVRGRHHERARQCNGPVCAKVAVEVRLPRNATVSVECRRASARRLRKAGDCGSMARVAIELRLHAHTPGL